MVTLTSSPFLAAADGQVGPHTPVWFMRQAGRSLPEYRGVRGEGSILDAIKQPDVAAEITLQPVRRYGVDAAVLYSDIVVPPHAVGFGIDVAPGTGPVATEPLRDRAGLARLRALEPDDIPYVAETVAAVAAELGDAGARAGLRRRAVHRRQLPDRGPAEPDLRAHQGPDAHRRGAVARRDGAAGRHGRDVHRRPADERRPRLPAVRLVGRGAVPAGLRALRAPPLPAGVRRARRAPPRRPRDPLRDRLRPPAGGDARRRAADHGPRLADVDHRRPPAARRRPRGPGQPRPVAGPGRRRGRARRAPAGCWPTTAATPATCSTSATASSPTSDPGVLAAIVDLVHTETAR